MGTNINLIDMLGLPETIECPHCGAEINSHFNDHDVECATTYEKGHWTLSAMYCDQCEKDFKYEFQLKVEVKNGCRHYIAVAAHSTSGNNASPKLPQATGAQQARMSERGSYQNVEQACGVMDSICASPALPPNLYDWQKEAWEYIRAYIKESQKHHTTAPCCSVGHAIGEIYPRCPCCGSCAWWENTPGILTCDVCKHKVSDSPIASTSTEHPDNPDCPSGCSILG